LPGTLADYAAGAQRADLGLAAAGGAQYPLAVLTDGKSVARFRLLLASDPDRTVDGQRAVVGEPHQCSAGEDLLLFDDLVRVGDDPKNRPGVVEDRAPFGLILGRENSIKDLDQLA
jgi:hypothetical protein